MNGNGDTRRRGARPRILILGAGFAGLAAARRLEETVGRAAEIVLVDRQNYFLFQPLLPEAATGTIAGIHVAVPLRRFFGTTLTRQGEVETVDPDERRVVVRYGAAFEPHDHELDYDHLVLALGSTTSFFGLPGLAEHAFTLGSLGDALRIRNRVIDALEQAEIDEDARRRRELLTFVVGGGSFTGVEIAAALADYLRHLLGEYLHVRPSDVRILLVEMQDRLLPGLEREAGAYAREVLERKGVEVRLETPLAAAEADHVVLGEDETVSTRTVVWAAGIEPPGVLADLSLAKDERGWLDVDATLRVRGSESVWAVGDCASVPDGEGGTYPATAQHAARQGEVVADNVVRALEGEELRPFRFESPGTLVGLGHRTGYANVRGRVVTGLPGWLLWRGVYLAKMPTFARRVRVGADWLVHAFSGPDIAEVPLERRLPADVRA